MLASILFLSISTHHLFTSLHTFFRNSSYPSMRKEHFLGWFFGLSAWLNFTTAGRMWMKFGMDIRPLGTNPKIKIFKFLAYMKCQHCGKQTCEIHCFKTSHSCTNVKQGCSCMFGCSCAGNYNLDLIRYWLHDFGKVPWSGIGCRLGGGNPVGRRGRAVGAGTACSIGYDAGWGELI